MLTARSLPAPVCLSVSVRNVTSRPTSFISGDTRSMFCASHDRTAVQSGTVYWTAVQLYTCQSLHHAAFLRNSAVRSSGCDMHCTAHHQFCQFCASNQANQDTDYRVCNTVSPLTSSLIYIYIYVCVCVCVCVHCPTDLLSNLHWIKY